MAKKSAKGKTKFKKISKSTVKEKSYRFFNALDFKSMSPEELVKKVQDTAVTVLAEHNQFVDPWCTFIKFEDQVVKTWDAEEVFIRFWLDRLIEEYGNMVWNVIFKKYYKDEWFTKGNLMDVPEMPAKLRNNPEAVASHLADSTMGKFMENFR